MRTRTADLASLLVAAALAWPSAASAAPDSSSADAAPYCTPTDEGLAELSGMAMLNGRLWAMGDSDHDDRVAELAAPAADGSCAVARWVPNPVAPFDVEDMAAFGPNLWLSDTGDNRRSRKTVALTRLDPATRDGELHRLTFPDGPHDVEALLIGGDGLPVLVTKEFSGAAGVFVPDVSDTLPVAPVDALPSPGPSPLRRSGQARLDTPTSSGSIMQGPLVTGGAVSADGRVAALRTYTDLYLYPVSGGNVAAALTSQQPRVIHLPMQPQGEAMTFTSGGDLLLGSENGAPGRPIPPILELRGIAGLVADPPVPVGQPVGTSTMTAYLVDPARPPDLRLVVVGLLGVGVLALPIARAVLRRRARHRSG